MSLPSSHDPNIRLCARYMLRKGFSSVKFFSGHQEWQNAPILSWSLGSLSAVPISVLPLLPSPCTHPNGCLSPHDASGFLSLSAAVENVCPRACSVACSAFPSLTLPCRALGSRRPPVCLPGIPVLGITYLVHPCWESDIQLQLPISLQSIALSLHFP